MQSICKHFITLLQPFHNHFKSISHPSQNHFVISMHAQVCKAGSGLLLDTFLIPSVSESFHSSSVSDGCAVDALHRCNYDCSKTPTHSDMYHALRVQGIACVHAQYGCPELDASEFWLFTLFCAEGLCFDMPPAQATYMQERNFKSGQNMHCHYFSTGQPMDIIEKGDAMTAPQSQSQTGLQPQSGWWHLTQPWLG